jgi:hypothetical protein
VPISPPSKSNSNAAVASKRTKATIVFG